MDQYRNKNILKWCDGIDCGNVNAKFVFKWGLTMEITNGRTWPAADFRVLQEEFSIYKIMYWILLILYSWYITYFTLSI